MSQDHIPGPEGQGTDVSPTLTVNTLGRLELHWNGRPLGGSNLRKTEALLIYLALNPDQQGRSRLAGLLWGDSTEDRARANLRHALWDLRRKTDAAAFQSDRRSIGLNPGVLCQVDVFQFEGEIEGAAGCRRRGELAVMVDHLEAALALYEGDFLERFDLPDCPAFDEWVMRRRVGLRERALEALTRLVTHYTSQGAYDEALRHARRQVSLEPWREEAHRDLMRLLALTGQRSAALAQYETCRQLLETELGLEPLAETTTLYERLVGWESSGSVQGNASPPIRQPTEVPSYPSGALPFAGREDEYRALLGWWEASRCGKGQLTLVEGEAGIGKTRLVEEVARCAEAEGASVLRGQCYEFATALPYQPIAEALRSSPLPLSLPPVWLSELSRLLPELQCMASDLPGPTQVVGEAARQRLFEAVARSLKHGTDSASRDSPPVSCLLFLDDLHWADPSTLDLLHYLVRQSGDAPFWVVGTYRPEEVGLSHPLTRLRQGLGRDRLVDHLTLTPLGPEAVERIARSLVGEREGAAFGDFLYCESEGNPFVLTEMINSLQEQGALRARGPDDEEKPWQWFGAPAVGLLPAGVRDVVLQRVGRLSESAQRLLFLAAVVGWGFDESLLDTAAGRDRHLTRGAVEEWLGRRLVQPCPRAGGHAPLSWPRYDFSHDKIRAVVYDTIADARRCTLHRRVAEALEGRLRHETQELAGLLAHHWERAGEPQKAADYHLHAGDQARLVYAHQEAVDHYQLALTALRGQGEHEPAARTLMKLGLTYHNAFDFGRARHAYDEAFALWQRLRATRSEASGSSSVHHAGQTLRVRWVEPTTLDPALVLDGDTRSLLAHLFSGLVALSPDLNVVPAVASSWEMSNGGRHFVFHLRDDIVWSDGRSVTAGDFEYAWKRTLDPITGSPVTGFLHALKGAQAFRRGKGSERDVGVRAVDDLTLLVELGAPIGYFLQLLSHVAYSPVPRHVVEKLGADWTNQEALVTNGPFRLEAWQQGRSLVLHRNSTHNGRLGGNLERVELFPAMDWSARLTAYEAGDLDVLGITYLPASERERARQEHAGEYVSGPRLETCYLVFDVSCSPFDDVRVRRAFAMATGREALADVVLQGYVSPATGGLVPPGMPGHSARIGLPYDPDRACRLLAEAGYAGGRGLPPVKGLAFCAARSRSDYLITQWGEMLGVETQWDVLPWAEFLDELKEDPPQILLLMWVADYPDPDNFLRVCRDRTWSGWQSESYDQLVEKARGVLDQEERMKLYGQAERLLVEEVPILPLTYERQHLLVKPWVRSYPTSALQAAFWEDAVVEPH